MFSHQFVMSVMGTLDQDLLKSLIRVTEKKLEDLEADEVIRKKIFHFVVECAQNLCNAEPENNRENNLFLIGKKGSEYVVFLGTMYSKIQSAQITDLINSVNKLEKAEVRDKFYAELATKNYAGQNHLLMSVLDMARRSRQKINYEIFPVNNELDFLSFNTSITSAAG